MVQLNCNALVKAYSVCETL